MAKADHIQHGEELQLLDNSGHQSTSPSPPRSRSSSPDDIIDPFSSHTSQIRPSLSIPRRQSSFARARPQGTPRTQNRVRFDVEDSVHSASVHDEEEDDEADDWLDEEDYMTGDRHTARRDGAGQRAPLLTDIEAPSVTLAESNFNPEDLLEAARPKSGMRSAFMNMANSIMYVYFDTSLHG